MKYSQYFFIIFFVLVMYATMPTSIILQDNSNYYQLAEQVSVKDTIDSLIASILMHGPNYFTSLVFILINSILNVLPFELYRLTWTFLSVIAIFITIKKNNSLNIASYVLPSIQFFILIAYGWRQAIAMAMFFICRTKILVLDIILLLLVAIGVHWSVLFFLLNEVIDQTAIRKYKIIVALLVVTFGITITNFSTLSYGEEKTPSLLVLLNLILVLLTPYITNGQVQPGTNTLTMIILWAVLLVHGIGTGQVYRLLPMTSVIVYRDINKINARLLCLQYLQFFIFTMFYARRIILG